MLHGKLRRSGWQSLQVLPQDLGIPQAKPSALAVFPNRAPTREKEPMFSRRQTHGYLAGLDFLVYHLSSLLNFSFKNEESWTSRKINPCGPWLGLKCKSCVQGWGISLLFWCGPAGDSFNKPGRNKPLPLGPVMASYCPTSSGPYLSKSSTVPSHT